MVKVSSPQASQVLAAAGASLRLPLALRRSAGSCCVSGQPCLTPGRACGLSPLGEAESCRSDPSRSPT